MRLERMIGVPEFIVLRQALITRLHEDAARQRIEELIESGDVNLVRHSATIHCSSVGCNKLPQGIIIVSELGRYPFEEHSSCSIRWRRIHADVRQDIGVILRLLTIMGMTRSDRQELIALILREE
jgi:hypothetical protein